MPDSNLLRLRRKNYLYAINAVVGSELFRHIYVRDKTTGREFDATDDGNGSCAYVVSGVLSLFGLIDRPHATVVTTIEKLKEAGWHETTAPKPGDLLYWPEAGDHANHIGFVVDVDAKTCVSNSSQQGKPILHNFKMSDGREPTVFYTNDLSESTRDLQN